MWPAGSGCVWLQGGSAGKRRQSGGQKRKALLELLEQVESLVQVGRVMHGWGL